MLWANYQIAKSALFTLTYLPILIRSRISKFFQGKTAIFKFFWVDKVNVGAVASVLKFFGLFFDIIEDVFVEVRWGCDL